MRGFIITAALMATVATLTPTAQARTKAIDGTCGMHIVGPVIPTTNEWNVRIGPRHDTPAGRLRCYGYVMAKGQRASRLVPSWVPFGCQLCADVYGWNWHGILYTGAEAAKTSLACAAFGRTFILKIPWTLWTGASTGAAGFGCVSGFDSFSHKLQGVNHVFTIRGFHG